MSTATARTVMQTGVVPFSKMGQVPIPSTEIVERPLAEVRPSPENDRLYAPVDPKDKDFRALVKSVRVRGVLDSLVISEDGYIISGHRRYAAATLARLATVPCVTMPVRREDDVDAFVQLLREFNRQRIKTFSEKAREALVDISPKAAHRRLVKQRAVKSTVSVTELKLDAQRVRAGITDAKQPLLDAILQVLDERRKYWPLSVRQVHYALLNNPPLKHASKPKSRYANDLGSYKNLDQLLVRARVEGLISWDAIGDETRPVTTWKVFDDPQQFIREEMDSLLEDYYRDLLQSQPNHIEVLVEKNTVAKICSEVCARYCMPMTSGRGFCSLPPRRDMEQRYRDSGKEKLILLIVSDFDPEGEVIAESFARYMRDDFGIEEICPIKVALNAEQVKRFNLPLALKAKEKSVNRRRFVEIHGENVWELEALEPVQLQALLDDAIRSVLDLEAYNAEIAAEATDAAQIEALRETVKEAIGDTDFEDFDDAD